MGPNQMNYGPGGGKMPGSGMAGGPMGGHYPQYNSHFPQSGNYIYLYLNSQKCKGFVVDMIRKLADMYCVSVLKLFVSNQKFDPMIMSALRNLPRN